MPTKNEFQVQQFLKKPIVVTAIRWYPSLNLEHLGICVKGIKLPPKEQIAQWWNKLHDKEMEAEYGDWIINQGNGDIYSFKPNIFEKNYERVVSE